MQLDYNTQYADGALAIAIASGGSADSTILDHMVAAWNGGAGTPVWVIAQIGTAFAGSASNSFYCTWSSSTASGGTYIVHMTSRTFSIAELTKGAYLMAQPIPAGATINRFTKMTFYNVLTCPSMTAGVYDAYLSYCAPRY
jgi:hypothetical protein